MRWAVFDTRMGVREGEEKEIRWKFGLNMCM